MEEINLQIGNSLPCAWMEERTFTTLKREEALSPLVLKIATERVVMQHPTCPHSSPLPLLGNITNILGPTSRRSRTKCNDMTWIVPKRDQPRIITHMAAAGLCNAKLLYYSCISLAQGTKVQQDQDQAGSPKQFCHTTLYCWTRTSSHPVYESLYP